MSYDPLFAYKESISGIENAVWPPVQAYLCFLSRITTGGPEGYFFGQTYLLFFSAALVCSFFIRRAVLWTLTIFVFFGLFIYFPTMVGTLAVLWKDVTTVSFALLGLALWLVAVRQTSVPWLLASIAVLSLGIAVRYNALPLFVFLLGLIALTPFGANEMPRARIYAVAAIILGLALVIASSTWRLPDFKRLPSYRGFAGVQMFDLLGISACAGHSYLPLGMSSGQPVSGEQIRQLYDPRHVELSFQPKPGLPQLIETDAGGEVQKIWRKLLPLEPVCYFTHRMRVFREQMGMAPGEVFYPTHGGIDENPYGIRLAHPDASLRFTRYILEASKSRWRRPILLYVLAVICTLAAFFLRLPGRSVHCALLAGALAYPATLFFVGPAADARYIFPSNVVCALLIVLTTALLIQRRFETTPAGANDVLV